MPTGTELLAERLIGRDDLRAALRVDPPATGSARRPVLVTGVAGIGKSRLLRDLAEEARARQEWVLQGRAIDGDGDAFRCLVEALSRFDLASGCRPGDHLWVAWQTMVRALANAGARPIVQAEELVRFFRVAGRRTPLVVILDDVHWADPQTLTALTYLCDNLEAHGAFVVMAARPADLPAELTRLMQRRVIDLLEVGPLSPGAVEELVLECLQVDAVDPALTDFIVTRAGGNPFAVEELIAGLVRSATLTREGTVWRVDAPLLHTVAPPTVASSVARRISDLPSTTRSALHAAAVIGHDVDWTMIPAMTGLTDTAVAEAFRTAQDAGLLSVSPSGVSFRHALTRDEVRRNILPPERHQLARKALESIVGTDGEPRDGRADLALELAEDAGDQMLWRNIMLRTGLDAAARGALAQAMNRLRPLVSEPDSVHDDVWTAAAVELTEILGAMGDHVAARDLGELVLTTLPAHRAETRRVGEALTRAALVAGDHEAAADQIATLLAANDPGPGLRGLQAQVLLEQGRLDAASALATELADEHGIDHRLRCEAMETAGRAERVADVAAGTAWFERELAEAQAAGDLHWQARAFHELGTIDLFDNLRTDRLDHARRLSIEIGDPHIIAHADFHLAEARVARGETLSGRIAAERAADVAGRIGSPVQNWAWLTTARSYAYDRDDPAMETAIARARTGAGGELDAIEAGVSGRVRALRALFGADMATTAEHLDDAADRLESLPGHHFPHWGLWALVRAAQGVLRSGDVERVRRASGADTRFNRALLDAALAVRAGTDGDRESATRLFGAAEDALRGYQGVEWVVHVTRWISVRAARQSGWGEPATWATEGVRWFSSHHHEPLAADSRQILREMGVSIPRRGRGHSQVPPALLERGVSSREVDVLSLIALRIPNAEIASRLVLSPRTVERHVGSLLAKLSARDRGELAELAEELRLV